MIIIIGFILLFISMEMMLLCIDKKLDKIMDHFKIEEKEEKK